jgi:hypothetical protein
MEFELYLQAKFDRSGESRIVRLTLENVALEVFGEKQTEPPLLAVYDGRRISGERQIPVFREPVTEQWLSKLREIAVGDVKPLLWDRNPDVGVIEITKSQRILDWLDDRLTPHQDVYYGWIKVMDDNADELRKLGIPVAEFDHKEREFVVRATPEQLGKLDPHWGKTMVWSLHMVPENLRSVTWSREAIAKLDDEDLLALKAVTRHQIIETGGRLTADESVQLDFALETLEKIDEEQAGRSVDSGPDARPAPSA